MVVCDVTVVGPHVVDVVGDVVGGAVVVGARVVDVVMRWSVVRSC